MSSIKILQNQQGERAHLHCHSGDVPTLIQVMDTARQPISEPVIGCLHITLPLGHYHVRFILGDERKEYTILLDQPGANTTLRNNSHWHLAGFIPDEKELGATEQRLLALTQYRETEFFARPRGQLVVIIQQMRPYPPYYHQELRLEQSNGMLVSSFQPAAENSRTPVFIYEWRGESGTYLLTLPGCDSKIKKLPITLCGGWQTQLFLLADAGNNIDLKQTSIAMTQLGKAFQSGDHILSLTESLRILLIKSMEKPIQVAQEGFWAHFSNPVVGLISAWLLLQSPDKNRALLTKMVIRLKQLIGWTPEVRALAWAILMDEPDLTKLKGWRKELAALPPLCALPTLQKSGLALLQAQQKFHNVLTPAVQDELFPLMQSQPGLLLVKETLL